MKIINTAKPIAILNTPNAHKLERILIRFHQQWMAKHNTEAHRLIHKLLLKRFSRDSNLSVNVKYDYS